MVKDRSTSRGTILYLVTEDWFFVMHRLAVATAASRFGFDVHVATTVHDDGQLISDLGFKLHPLSWKRGSLNPADNIAMLLEVRRLCRTLKPDIVHSIALQPAVLSSVALLGIGIEQLNSLVGLGFTFTSSGPKAKFVRAVLKFLWPRLANRPNVLVTVENADDKSDLLRLGIASDKVRVLPGSGVDTARLQPLPEPATPVTIAFVGRLLGDKGLATLIDAYDIMASHGCNARLIIAGEPDLPNPTSIPADEVGGWKQRKGISVLGHVSNIEDVWKAAHIAVLPSRREGMPLSLLEAAACGRPLVATDVPGCRELVRHGVNGLLVPVDNAPALAEALELLVKDPERRQNYGRAARDIAVSEYSTEIVNRQALALYEAMAHRPGNGLQA
jgi:glycosyltransferase involved in cell wall biosynthesis